MLKDKLMLLTAPIILLIRYAVCQVSPMLVDTAVCDVSALFRILSLHQPWEAFYALQPTNWLDSSALGLLLMVLCLLAMLYFVFLYLAPTCPTFYIQPSQGLNELALRLISMFMRSVYAIAYVWAYNNHYSTPAQAPDAHKFAMQAITSHYVVRGIEALLLRRYSAPFFPPQLAHPLPAVCGVAVYMYHYFLVFAHFTWMKSADWGTNYGVGIVNESWMYTGYLVAVFGQVLMLKQADVIPKSSFRQGFVWRGEVISWIGIGFISQHPGVWLLVLSIIPFAYFEELMECYTGQRYARLCTPLRSKSAVFLKDAPALATDIAPALVEASEKYGECDLCVVRPRSTQETSDVYLVFSDSDDAGMAASNIDGKNFAGWRANAIQRRK